MNCQHLQVVRGVHRIGSVSFGVLKCVDCSQIRLQDDDHWLTLDGKSDDAHVLAALLRSLQRAQAEAFVIR